MHYEWACIDTTTNEIRNYQTFMEGEILPTDIPHKNIAWKPLVTLRVPFSPDTHRELEPTITIYEDRVEKVYTLQELTEQEKESRVNRKIQEKFFNEHTRHMTILIRSLLNDVRELRGMAPISEEEFFHYLKDFL